MPTPPTGNHSSLLPMHPHMADHSAHPMPLTNLYLLPVDDPQPQQVMVKNQPKPPHGIPYLVNTTSVKHSSLWPVATPSQSIQMPPHIAYSTKPNWNNIEQPLIIESHCKQKGYHIHTAINTAILVLTTNSNIPPFIPTQWLAMGIHGASQPLTDNILPLTNTANSPATALHSHLQCLFYSPMLLYNIHQSEWPAINNQPLDPYHKPHNTVKWHSLIMQVHIITVTLTSNHKALAHALHAMTMDAANNQLNNSKIPNDTKKDPRPSQITAHATYSTTYGSTPYHTYHLPPMDNLPYADRLCTSLVQHLHITSPTTYHTAGTHHCTFNHCFVTHYRYQYTDHHHHQSLTNQAFYVKDNL